MKLFKRAATIPALTLVLSAGAASAANITPDVIFGSGNANGDFTVDQQNASGIELGLRGKLRFNDSNQPENTFNYDGGDTYTFEAGTPDLTLSPQATGFPSWASNDTPIWNFEWSVNSNFDGSGGNLNAFDYVLELDTDPGAGTNVVSSFDPINVESGDRVPDHAFGTNSTGNGGGSEATNALSTVSGSNLGDYGDLIANNNVAQNSWSYEFFNTNPGDPTFGFDPNALGQYSITFSALDQRTGAELASTSINISVVPLPATLPFLLTVLGGFGLAARARRKAA